MADPPLAAAATRPATTMNNSSPTPVSGFCSANPLMTATVANVPIMKISECAKLIRRSTP